MRNKDKRPRVISIEWVDASTLPDWIAREDAEQHASLKRCRTVGYLLDITKETVRLYTSECADDGDIADVWSIPRVNIRQLIYLKS